MDQQTKNLTWHGESELSFPIAERGWAGVDNMFDEDVTTFWNPGIAFPHEGRYRLPMNQLEYRDNRYLRIKFEV